MDGGGCGDLLVLLKVCSGGLPEALGGFIALCLLKIEDLLAQAGSVSKSLGCNRNERWSCTTRFLVVYSWQLKEPFIHSKLGIFCSSW